jgi:hypothetical protein
MSNQLSELEDYFQELSVEDDEGSQKSKLESNRLYKLELKKHGWESLKQRPDATRSPGYHRRENILALSIMENRAPESYSTLTDVELEYRVVSVMSRRRVRS